MGVLTRNEMEQVIVVGGSVLFQGRLIGRVQDLPTDADLAKGNPEQEAHAAAALDAQIAALQTQRARLVGGQSPQIGAPATGTPAPVTTPPATPAEPEKGGTTKHK